jgi:Fe-S cluster biosynthesis and repair protein YggX
MANCHNLFKDFFMNIKLSKSNKTNLIEARDAIEDRIKKYFKNRDEKAPVFYEQGSFALDTVITPLDGEFDIDYGVYLQNIKNDNLPPPDKVHNWIYKAVEGHTQESPKDKRTCVRVVYAGFYHVDLPIYNSSTENSLLAEKGEKGWHESNPVAFTNWFNEKVKTEGEQLSRAIHYIKAWADFKSSNIKLPKSFILTILATNLFKKSERDDVSFTSTMKSIYESINISTFITNPVNPGEIISNRVTESQWSNFKEKLTSLLDNANVALNSDDKEEASKSWRKVFGDRFPVHKGPKEGEKPLKTKSPAILGDNGRSA